jgi:hypothetical protein
MEQQPASALGAMLPKGTTIFSFPPGAVGRIFIHDMACLVMLEKGKTVRQTLESGKFTALKLSFESFLFQKVIVSLDAAEIAEARLQDIIPREEGDWDWWQKLAQNFIHRYRSHDKMRWDVLPRFREIWGNEGLAHLFLHLGPDLSDKGNGYDQTADDLVQYLEPLDDTAWLNQVAQLARHEFIRSAASTLISLRGDQIVKAS